MSQVKVQSNYPSIQCIRDLCEPWIDAWGGDEWGDSMYNLHGASHTDYGFSYEDCALFAFKLIENLEAMKVWMDDEGRELGIFDPKEEAEAQERCHTIRAYWLEGGNLKSESARQRAKETLATVPGWLFGEEL